MADNRKQSPAAPAGAGTTFVGRSRELSQLDEALANNNGAGVGYLVGPAGMGKTSLAARFADGANDRGAMVWRACCWAGQNGPPFLIWSRLLSSLPPGLDDLAAKHRGPDSLIERIAPGWVGGSANGSPSRSTPSTTTDARVALFEAVTSLLTDLLRHSPLLMVIDDAQGADPASGYLLRHLLRARLPGQLMVLLVGRERAEGSPWRAVLPDPIVDLKLQGLGKQEIGLLVSSLTGRHAGPAQVELIDRYTGGNPLYITELLKPGSGQAQRVDRLASLDLKTPVSLRRVLVSRMGGSSELHRKILGTAAVIGQGFNREMLASVCKASGLLKGSDAPAVVAEAIAKANEAELVVPDEEGLPGWSFSHAIMRDAFYDDIDKEIRRKLHLAVATTLYERATAGEPVSAAAIAGQFQDSGSLADRDKLVWSLEQAAREAMASTAYENAVAYLQSAIDADDRANLLYGLAQAECYRLMGESKKADALFVEAAAAARDNGDTLSLARASLGYGYTASWQAPSGGNPKALAMLREALEALDQGSSKIRVMLISRLAMMLGAASDPEAGKLSESAVAEAEALGNTDVLIQALASRLWVLWGPADSSARLDTSERLILLAARRKDWMMEVVGRTARAGTLLEMGSREKAEAEMESIEELARRTGQPWARWRADSARSLRAMLDGDLEQALRWAESELDYGLKVDASTATLKYQVHVFGIWRCRGQQAELEQPLRDILANRPELVPVKSSLALLLVELDRTAEAEPYYHELMDGMNDLPVDMVWLATIAALADLATALEDVDGARRIATILEPWADSHVCTGVGVDYTGPVTLRLGQLATTTGDFEAAEGYLQRALESALSMRAPLVASHAAVALAELKIKTGRTRSATELLELAAGRFHACGAVYYEQHAHRILAALQAG
ncbi:MAG: AAA family ATPase [Proteobacteria bacterium]|nr:AAA family ATPase [Pseudomonadota bacterium]